MSQAAGKGREKIEKKEKSQSHSFFYVVGENPKKPEVSKNMHEIEMKKRIGNQGKKIPPILPNGFWNHGELFHKQEKIIRITPLLQQEFIRKYEYVGSHENDGPKGENFHRFVFLVVQREKHTLKSTSKSLFLQIPKFLLKNTNHFLAF